MKQTAVEWLIEQMKTKQFIYLDRTEILNQALEMEKEQIVKAHGNKKKNSKTTGNYEYTYTGEMYFNDNYFKK
jgi:hypothetical protein